MKMRVFTKDIGRSIRHSWGRFWAIFAIVALGAGFYAGLRATAPDMQATGDYYFDQGYMMDLRLLSGFGFSQKDVDAIGEVPGVEGVMAGHTADALASLNEKDLVIRVHSLPENMDSSNPDYLNRPVLVEGRMPQNSGECLVSRDKTGEGVAVGDTVTFTSGSWKDSFSRREFTVVGLVDSPYYISFSLGSTNLGSGSVNRFMYILDEDFNQSAITDLFVTVEGAREESCFTDAYWDKVEAVQTALETLGEERDDLRYDEVLADSRKELEDGWAEYESGKAEAEQELEDGRQKLKDARKELEDAQAELSDGWQQYEEGKAQLEDAQAQLNDSRKAYEEGRTQWEEGYEKYESGMATYQEGLAAYEAGMKELADAEEKLAQGEQQLEASRPLYTTASELNLKISQWEASAGSGESDGSSGSGESGESGSTETAEGSLLQQGQARELPTDPEALQQMAEILNALSAPELSAALSQLSPEELAGLKLYLSQVVATFEKSQQELTAARQELETKKQEALPQLEEAKAQLDASLPVLQESKKTLDATELQLEEAQAQIQQGQAELDEGNRTLAASRKELENGQKELEDGWAELTAGEEEYEQEKANALVQLEDARKELEDAQRELDEISVPEWYVMDRSLNVGYASFEADTWRMDSLSGLFPVIFFLVAALVALTTMTRMVEEERGIIGTYKALGYSKARIAGKYLAYAALATAGACVVGVILGFFSLPTICWNAYRMLYTAPDLVAHFKWEYGVIGSGAALLCTLGATLAACRSTLAETPAQLMQPKAPKAGKRILLERLPFLWKRLKFTQKVTCRNLFRYKKRLIMTVVGIAGCTGLLVTGFGIKDSVSSILSNQYQDIYHFNLTATLQDGELSQDARDILEDSSLFSGFFLAHKESMEIYGPDSSMTGFLFVPQNREDLKSFITLRDRVSGRDVPFEENSVVITEKLAQKLGLSVGDTVTLQNSSGTRVPFTITDITENYVYHYVYIDPALYEEKMGETLKFTEVNAQCLVEGEQAEETIEDRLLAAEGIATATFTDTVSRTFEDMIQSLNFIILVIVICAGALAFVVLYNLTNINITERQRELATIKVLGFYDREVGAYIYREIILLTILGCAAGLFFGVFLHSFVIQTVEVDMVMFGRHVEPLSFLWSGLITMGFSLIVNLFMSPKLRKIDMVESLKSVE